MLFSISQSNFFSTAYFVGSQMRQQFQIIPRISDQTPRSHTPHFNFKTRK